MVRWVVVPAGTTRLRTWLWILGLAAIAMAPACDLHNGTTETRENSFRVSSSPRVQVEASNGYITVVSGPDGSIVVKAIIREPDDVEYAVTQTGYTIFVTANEKSSSGFGFGGSPGASIEIITPSNTTLDLHTSNGRIEVRGIRQSGSLITSNGKIVADDVSGEYQLRTSNGGIEFDGVLTPGGNNRMETSNGSITIKLRGTPSVNLDASTSNGSVNSELPITTESFGDNHIIGKIGDGESELTVRTSNGSIQIE